MLLGCCVRDPARGPCHNCPPLCRACADDIQSTCDSLGFEKLKILLVEPGKDENEGYVTFQVGKLLLLCYGALMQILLMGWCLTGALRGVGMLAPQCGMLAGLRASASGNCAAAHSARILLPALLHACLLTRPGSRPKARWGSARRAGTRRRLWSAAGS